MGAANRIFDRIFLLAAGYVDVYLLWRFYSRCTKPKALYAGLCSAVVLLPRFHTHGLEPVAVPDAPGIHERLFKDIQHSV